MEKELKQRLIKTLSVQTESHNQFRMFAYIVRTAKAIPGLSMYQDNGNLYITKGKPKSKYPCIVAHMDTVHDIVEDLTVINVRGNLTGFNCYMMEQTGIGGDDKVGIFIALECLRLFDNIKVAFFRDEEIGCEGSYMCDTSFFADCGFVLQCDRQGNKDFVTDIWHTKLSSKQFQRDVEPYLTGHGYKFTTGMMTDVQALKENGISCSMANMSCGYYNPHTAQEFVNLLDVENCLNMVQAIVFNLGGKDYYHAYTDGKPKKKGKGSNIFDDSIDDQIFSDFNFKDFDLKKLRKYEPLCADCSGPNPLPNGLCKKCSDYYYEYFGRDVNEHTLRSF